MSPAKVALGVGLLIGAAAVGTTLSKAPITVAGVNTTADQLLGALRVPATVCQSGEHIPQKTSAVRLRIFAYLGPRVEVAVYAQGRAIARGERESGWTGGAVTVPVRPPLVTTSSVELCFELMMNGNESAYPVGKRLTQAGSADNGGSRRDGQVKVEYLRSGPTSWWSLAPTVARHMGLGHAWSGMGSVLLVIFLIASVIGVCSYASIRGLS